MSLAFGSPFAGIGGFDLGLERAGATCKWQIEIDADCQQLLADKFPRAALYPDITKYKEYNLESVDIICGGWPCQDHSVVGKGCGLAGERSGLFFDLAELIRDLRPRWFVLENVPGLFSSRKGEDFAVVVKALTELGYGISWRVLDAQWFGVAQRRRRVFVVGYFGAPCPPQVLFERESGAWEAAPGRETGAELARDVAASIEGGSWQRGFPIDYEVGPTVAFPDPAYALAAARGSRFGSGRDGQDTFAVAPLTTSPCGALGVRRLTPRECERLQGFPDDWTVGFSDSTRYRMLGNAVAVPCAEWISRRIVAAS